MSVAVISAEALWVVESPHDIRNWFAMPTPGDWHHRAVFVKCEPHRRQWWKMLVTASLPHPGRLPRVFEYFHNDGGHVAVVFRQRDSVHRVEHHLQGDRYENVYEPTPPYSIIKLNSDTDSAIVQRVFDKNVRGLFMGQIDPAELLQKLIDDGMLDGVLTKIDLVAPPLDLVSNDDKN